MISPTGSRLVGTPQGRYGLPTSCQLQRHAGSAFGRQWASGESANSVVFAPLRREHHHGA